MYIVIVVMNHKGGVGKTTVAVNLGHALTRRNLNVLVVDCDTQANASDILLQGEPSGDSMYELYGSDNNYNPADCIYPTDYERLYCLPNVAETSGHEPTMITGDTAANLSILRNRLRTHMPDTYDVILIDCPPNMGFFVISALYAADFAIVPVWAGSSFSIKGLTNAIELINGIKNSGNPDLRFLRLLINGVDRRTSMGRIGIEQIRKYFKEDQVFETMIPINAAFQRDEHEKKTIIRHDPTALGSRAYRELAQEVINICGLEV
jgi:cellulose biosynthesis protein BcsQ